MALSADVRAKIQEAYPSFSYLLDHPEVSGLLEQAFTEGWSENRFISQLYATNYYRSRSEAFRRAEVLAQLDPAEYQRQRQANYYATQEFAAKLGFHLTNDELIWIAASELNEGGSINDPGSRMRLIDFMRSHPERIGSSGSIYANAQRADQISRQEYFYAPDNASIMRTGIDMAMGLQTEEAYRESLSEWFAAITPHLANRLKAGESYAQIVNPYRDIISNELELGGLENVDMVSNNQWKWLLGLPDPTSGEVRLPTQQEVIEAARKDGRWKGTVGATTLATEAVAGITERFGLRA